MIKLSDSSSDSSLDVDAIISKCSNIANSGQSSSVLFYLQINVRRKIWHIMYLR